MRKRAAATSLLFHMGHALQQQRLTAEQRAALYFAMGAERRTFFFSARGSRNGL